MRDRAQQFLAKYLADGPQPANQIRSAARAAGIGLDYLDKLSSAVVIKAQQKGPDGVRRSYWHLKLTSPRPRNRGTNSSNPLRPSGGNRPDRSPHSQDGAAPERPPAPYRKPTDERSAGEAFLEGYKQGIEDVRSLMTRSWLEEAMGGKADRTLLWQKLQVAIQKLFSEASQEHDLKGKSSR